MSNGTAAEAVVPQTPVAPAVLSYGGLMGRLAAAWFALVAPLAALGALDILRLHRAPSIATLYFIEQDMPLLVGAGLLMILLARTSGFTRWAGLAAPRGWPWMLAAAAGAWALAGTYVAFRNYGMSLDEFMAEFDGRIFRAGALFAHLPQAWRPFAEALQPIFTIYTPGHAAWASSYLPVNAAIRALASTLGAEAWVNPVWTAIAVLATAGAARRIWPDQPATALIAAILLATSSQVLITGMSAYAMPAHLALNMLWLWAFLRGGRGGHATALICGFLATGLHQLVFHPLFVAPFVLQLWLERRWRVAALYTVAYAFICGFWLMYWPLAQALSDIPGGVANAGGPTWFVERVAWLLARFSPANAGAMSLDLVRFIAWQHPFTVPLALLGLVAALRARGVLCAMVLGVVLTLLAIFVLLPYQDHGWGYRYLHGQLGAICLLAAWTWERLIARTDPATRRASTFAFLVATIAAVVIMAPLNTLQAALYIRPYAAAHTAIQSADVDVVIVDRQDSWYTEALVRNDPWLPGRPKVMKLSALTDYGVRLLCASSSVAIFDRRDAAQFGIGAAKIDDPVLAHTTGRLRALMAEIRCGTRHVGDLP